MDKPLVDVFENGAVCLGPEVVCDGYADGFPFRIQTHVHDDHMGDFDKSKGLQDIFMSCATYEFLLAERNAELAYRDNLYRLPYNTEYVLGNGSKLSLIPSNHMLGSCQVMLELSSGLRVGYSGDFGWPMEEVIQVDQLIIDSTYGNPTSVRRYSQDEAEKRLLEVVSERLRYGPVHIHAYRGTIERALQVIGDNVGVPIVATDRRIQEINIYQKYGLAAGAVVDLDSVEGKAALNGRSYIRLYAKGDGLGNEPVAGTKIKCSAYMVGSDDPVRQFTDGNYSIALTNHADFDETLKYIEATGAKVVVTDNTRNHGMTLAAAINDRLPAVFAVPSSNKSGLTDSPL